MEKYIILKDLFLLWNTCPPTVQNDDEDDDK